MGQLTRTIALVGMMGAGKSSIGRRLAARMQVGFRDADTEIESAAGRPVPAIFAEYGEAAFRECESRVIARLLETPAHILATGGGAFMTSDTRERLRQKATTVWLRAPVDILFARVKRKGERPLLNTANPRETLERILREREPTYALADIIIDSEDAPHGETVEKLLLELTAKGDWQP
jgi:shikimate kinase